MAVVVVAHEVEVGHAVDRIADTGEDISMQAFVAALGAVSFSGQSVVFPVFDRVDMVLAIGGSIPSFVVREVVASTGVEVYRELLICPSV